MGLPKDLALYGDIEGTLRTARENGGGAFSPPGGGSVVRWIQRAYYYRKLLRARAAAALPPGAIARTEYDAMTLAPSLDRTQVLIRFNIELGTFTPFDGEAVELEEAPVADPLLTEALSLMRSKGGEE